MVTLLILDGGSASVPIARTSLLQGWVNILLYFVAFTVSLLGQVMDGLSRCTVHC